MRQPHLVRSVARLRLPLFHRHGEEIDAAPVRDIGHVNAHRDRVRAEIAYSGGAGKEPVVLGWAEVYQRFPDLVAS